MNAVLATPMPQTNVKALKPLGDVDSVCYSAGFACKPGEPVENALHLAKLWLQKIERMFPECPREEWRLYISGADNFRVARATLAPYKGNRDPNRKPEHFAALRDYFITWNHAVIIDGREPDDAIGCDQWACKTKDTVICSIDGDLSMIPGWHYNHRKDALFYVSKREADLNFWRKTLQGDRSDNIPGIPGIGVKTCEKIIEECGSDTTRVRARVHAEYRRHYKDAWEEALQEVADLAWVQREEGKTCPWLW